MIVEFTFWGVKSICIIGWEKSIKGSESSSSTVLMLIVATTIKAPKKEHKGSESSY